MVKTRCIMDTSKPQIYLGLVVRIWGNSRVRVLNILLFILVNYVFSGLYRQSKCVVDRASLVKSPIVKDLFYHQLELPTLLALRLPHLSL